MAKAITTFVREHYLRQLSWLIINGQAKRFKPIPNRGHHVLSNTQSHNGIIIEERTSLRQEIISFLQP